MASSAESSDKDINWWLRAAVAIIAVIGALLTVGGAVAARPTREEAQALVRDGVKAHAEGYPAHAELKEIQAALNRLQVDVAVIKAAVTTEPVRP